MFYKASDPKTCTRDWRSLNSEEIPTEALAELYPIDAEDGRELQRLDLPGVEDCEVCEASGWNDDTGDECEACDGRGEIEPDEHAELCAYPAAHGLCWRVENRDDIRDAAIAAGFVVYDVDEGPFDGDLILCVDGGNYGFDGQHWIPLRAELARQQCRANEDPTAWGFIRAELREAADREGETHRFDRMFPINIDGGAS